LGTIGFCLRAEQCTLELLLCAGAGGTATRPNRSFMANSLCRAPTEMPGSQTAIALAAGPRQGPWPIPKRGPRWLAERPSEAETLLLLIEGFGVHGARSPDHAGED